MCKITHYRYACGHHIQHVWSSCRGRIKSGSISVCQKSPSINLNIKGKCGSCTRHRHEAQIRQELQITSAIEDATLSPSQQALLDTRLRELSTQIPTNNWRQPSSPTYSRRPSNKRSGGAPRKTSLLRCEVKAEDACGPEAFESDDFVPDTARVYETVSWGWDYERTPETKSLADEISEDVERRMEESGGKDEGRWWEDGSGDLDESDQGGGDEESNDEMDLDSDAEPDSTASTSSTPSSPVSEGGVRYWFRKRSGDDRGKIKSRIWELVQVG
ncbi:hypothetical protein Q7P37_007730 [Cladosporium fusiforme]